MQSVSDFQFDPDRHYEFVDGEWQERKPEGALHGGTMGRLNRHLCEFVEQENRGRVYLFCSYQIGANERIIDLSFISTARIPPEGEPDTKWMIAPDLAVEIISHTDLYCDVYRRLTDYLNANVKQVWLVNPSDHSVMIYRSYADITVFTDDAEWTCEDLLSGFRLPLHKVFNPS